MREGIILDIVSTLESIEGIKDVRRVTPQRSDLVDLPAGNFPMIFVNGQMPVVTYPAHYSQSQSDSKKNCLTSALDVDLAVFGYAENNADEEISWVLNAIWKSLLVDRSRGGHAHTTQLQPESTNFRLTPYYAFEITVQVEYDHNYEEI